MNYNFSPGQVYSVILNSGITYKQISYVQSEIAADYPIVKHKLKGIVDVFTHYNEGSLCIVYIQRGTYKSVLNLNTPMGYVLLYSYPGCNKPIGYFEPYTTGYYSNWPMFWFPVYEYQLSGTPIIVETDTHTFEIFCSDKLKGDVYVKITPNGQK